jgi:hypothetical protein
MAALQPGQKEAVFSGRQLFFCAVGSIKNYKIMLKNVSKVNSYFLKV